MSAAPRGLVLVLVATLAIVACGCGAAATPTPAPTPTPTTAPTPTPVDVAAMFVEQVAAVESANMPFTGTALIGEVEAALSGTLGLSGTDTRSTFVFDVDGAKQTQESIRIGTQRWARDGEGPWVLDPEPADPAKTTSAYLLGLTSLEDKGVETKDGRELHHLVPPASNQLTPEVFGLPPSVTDAEITTDFWAEDDGTPAIWTLVASWTQGDPGTPMSTTMDIDLSGLGAAVTIAPPADAWTGFTSKRFAYSMARAPGWSVDEQDGVDVYLLEGTPYVYVSPQDLAAGYTLDRFHDDLVAYYEANDIKAAPVADEDYAIDGNPARVLTYRFTNASGTAVYLVDAITVRADTGWEIYLAQEQTGEEEARAFFDTMMSTFSFEE